MGNVEDLRKVLQDVIAPDIKALSARVDGLERRIDAFDKSVNLRFDTLAQTLAANHAALLIALDLERRMVKIETRAKQEEASH
jgi:hypothetical protein